MTDMQDSIILLSSMSPNVNKFRTINKKKVTKLSLKRQIRRTSVYDKLSHIRNSNVICIESSSTDSAEYCSSNNEFTETTENVEKKEQMQGNSIIVVDSFSDSSINSELVISNTTLNVSFEKDLNNKKIVVDEPYIEGHDDKAPKRELKACETINFNNENSLDELLKKYDVDSNDAFSTVNYKMLHINKFVDDWLEPQNICTTSKNEMSRFSEVSTIPGSYKLEENAALPSVNSTLLPNGGCIRFDELFRTKKNKKRAINNVTERKQRPGKNDCNLSLNESLQKLTIEDSFVIENSFQEVESNHVAPDIPLTPLIDQERLLDELYGNSWRTNQDKILPKTEEKCRTRTISEKISKTDIKSKKSLTYKNPYLDTERKKSNLLKTLQSAKIRMNLESPWTNKLKHLCDPASSENNESDSEKLEHYNTDYRKKLNFVDSDCSSDDENKIPKDGRIATGRQINGKIKNKICKTVNVPKTVENDVKKVKKKRPVRAKGKHVKISSTSSDSSDSDSPIEDYVKSKTNTRNEKGREKSYSFLASLSSTVPVIKCEPTARIFRENYKGRKEELTKRLYELYNEKIFENKLPADLLIQWNSRMRGTAGFCYSKKIIRRNGVVERSARIVLAPKVVDSADRLRDTLVHEMCHAATWIINEVSNGHGCYWRAWADKCMTVFPELPPIKRCHDYNINTKYTYRCVDCGYSIGRHSKSLDIERKRCGHCYGKFEVLINKVTKDGVKTVPATPRKAALTGFANFIKENYANVKKQSLTHSDVMKILSKQFKDMKMDNM